MLRRSSTHSGSCFHRTSCATWPPSCERPSGRGSRRQWDPHVPPPPDEAREHARAVFATLREAVSPREFADTLPLEFRDELVGR
jgi:hypothetical protein